MRHQLVIVIVIAAAAVVAAGGCGTTGSDGPTPEKAKSERQINEQIAREDCADRFRDLRDSLDELGSRLDIGLSYDEYTTAVGDVKVAYDKVDFDALDDFRCLRRAGVRLERALRIYAKAAGMWGDCIGDLDCDDDSLKPKLQAKWLQASAAAEKAGGYLDGP